jgi:hypothetical protein
MPNQHLRKWFTGCNCHKRCTTAAEVIQHDKPELFQSKKSWLQHRIDYCGAISPSDDLRHGHLWLLQGEDKEHERKLVLADIFPREHPNSSGFN